MSGRLAVTSDDSPAISQNPHGRNTSIDHGLNRQSHARLKDGCFTSRSVVGNLGLLVKIATHSMANKFPHNTESEGSNKLLYSATEISESFPSTGVINGAEERLFSRRQETLSFKWDISNSNRGGIITNKASLYDTHINADNVTRHDFAGTSYTMNDFFIYRDASVGRETTVSEKGTIAAVLLHQLRGQLIYLSCSSARNCLSGDRLENT